MECIYGYYPYKITILGSIVCFIGLSQLYKNIKFKMNKKDVICNLEIEIENKNVTIPAMIDTGNMLKEPITGSSVVVVEKEKIAKIFPNSFLDKLDIDEFNNLEKITQTLEGTNYLSRFRLIPFSAVGKKRGMLVGFRVDKVKIISNEFEIEKEKVIVGLYDNSLSQNEKYNALIGIDLIS